VRQEWHTREGNTLYIVWSRLCECDILVCLQDTDLSYNIHKDEMCGDGDGGNSPCYAGDIYFCCLSRGKASVGAVTHWSSHGSSEGLGGQGVGWDLSERWRLCQPSVCLWQGPGLHSVWWRVSGLLVGLVGVGCVPSLYHWLHSLLHLSPLLLSLHLLLQYHWLSMLLLQFEEGVLTREKIEYCFILFHCVSFNFVVWPILTNS